MQTISNNQSLRRSKTKGKHDWKDFDIGRCCPPQHLLPNSMESICHTLNASLSQQLSASDNNNYFYSFCVIAHTCGFRFCFIVTQSNDYSPNAGQPAIQPRWPWMNQMPNRYIYNLQISTIIATAHIHIVEVIYRYIVYIDIQYISIINILAHIFVIRGTRKINMNDVYDWLDNGYCWRHSEYLQRITVLLSEILEWCYDFVLILQIGTVSFVGWAFKNEYEKLSTMHNRHYWHYSNRNANDNVLNDTYIVHTDTLMRTYFIRLQSECRLMQNWQIRIYRIETE